MAADGMPEQGQKGWLDRIGEIRLRTRAWRGRYHMKPVFSVFIYLIIPLTCIQLIMVQYPLLAKERFYRMMTWIVPIGISLVMVTLVQERFGKGTRSRLFLDGVYVALVMTWLFGFLGGRTVIRSNYGGWDFSVDVTPIVIIILVGTSLNFVHDILEYLAASKDDLMEAEVVGLDKDDETDVVFREEDLVTIRCSDG